MDRHPVLALVVRPHGVEAARVEDAGELPAPGRVGEERPVVADRRRVQAPEGPGRDPGHVDREHPDRARRPDEASRPVSGAATGPPYRGLSRQNVTGRVVRTGSPTTTTSWASTQASIACSSSERPRCSTEALSAPSSRAARPPASTTAAKPNVPGGSSPWQSRRVARLRLALVQHASGLDPAGNRELLGRLTPAGTDLVVFPEAFARDFGDPAPT